jgi:hypothetical protein
MFFLVRKKILTTFELLKLGISSIIIEMKCRIFTTKNIEKTFKNASATGMKLSINSRKKVKKGISTSFVVVHG